MLNRRARGGRFALADKTDTGTKDLEKTGRPTRITILELVGFQDFLALLMVLATALSAMATWRAARVTANVFMASERPYVGVQAIHVDLHNPAKPLLEVEFRDYGHIPADATVVSAWLTVGGKRLPNDRHQRHVVAAGVLSPQVAHFFHIEVPPNILQELLRGAVTLTVAVAISYTDETQRSFCYRMNFLYNAATGNFDANGGSDRCGKGVAGEG